MAHNIRESIHEDNNKIIVRCSRQNCNQYYLQVKVGAIGTYIYTLSQ